MSFHKKVFQFIKNSQGQMAIFLVLIFQVLFILFAMTINVALVVHDKINLQNSLDMAAYYGAKKQAEVLNAMAHINYQMRQNWKLLAWRYRVLGTLNQVYGQYMGGCPSPDDYQRPVGTDYWCPQNKDCETNCSFSGPPTSQACNQARVSLPYPGGYCDNKYFVCISSDFWRRGINKGELNMCTKVAVFVPTLDPLVMVPGIQMPSANLVASITKVIQKEADESCEKEGALNWLMTQFFLTHFRLDQRDRKTMLRAIYKKTLQEGKDLDGKSVFEGAKKVFLHNLNQVNRKNVGHLPDKGLEDFNSFQNVPFKEVFEYVNTFPILQYLDGVNGNSPPNSGQKCSRNSTKSHHHIDPNSNFTLFYQGIENRLSTHALSGYLKNNTLRGFFSLNMKVRAEEEQFPIGGLTLGFIKKPDKILYYGLSVEFEARDRNQIFSLDLNNSLEFRASAFAKPFGGRFGPDFEQRDRLIPVLSPDPSKTTFTQLNSFLLQPNHSRWPGDVWGLLDRELHQRDKHFLRKLFKDNTGNIVDDFYTIESFFHLIFFKTADDPLARPPLIRDSPEVDPMAFLRLMELMAVSPDVYDLSYYSVSANYHRTYFPKICKLLYGGECKGGADKRYPFSSNPEAYIRGDFGWPETEEYIKKNQQEKKVDLSIAPYFLTKSRPEIELNGINADMLGRDMRRRPRPRADLMTSGKIFYPWLADLPDHLLSSWTPTTDMNRYQDYIFPEQIFLKCEHKALKGKPVHSSCAAGGRSGYSVKLISCETVKDFPSETKKPSNIDDRYCS